MTGTQTKQRDGVKTRRWRGPAIAVGAFAVVLIAAVSVFVVASVFDDADSAGSGVESSAPPVATTEAIVEAAVVPEEAGPIPDSADVLVGTTGKVVGGTALARPDQIELGEDGTYGVVDSRQVINSGKYEISGDVITFETDPTDELIWVSNPVQVRMVHTCEGLVGEYNVVFQDATTYTLEVVWDECPPRVTIANGLQLEIS